MYKSTPFHISSLLLLHRRLPKPLIADPPIYAIMKVVAAFLLAVLSGKASPTSGDIKTILGSVGAESEDAQIELLLKEVNGKDLVELIAAGREKLASVPSGGGGGVAVASVPSASGGGGGGAPAAESKKEEKKEEKEESDDDMGFSLFE